ncbi:MAG: hypothetical protein HYX74_00645 [Acidobacteria bacterium]|nr:hypothetical protein [Acidobacteriota bacterium]
MSKVSVSLLMPSLLVSLVAVSFSVCQGFYTDRAEFSLPVHCSAGDFCHRMCMLTQDDSPTLAQKSFIQSVEAAITALLMGPALEVEDLKPPAAAIIGYLKTVHEYAGAEVYLLNATLLV